MAAGPKVAEVGRERTDYAEQAALYTYQVGVLSAMYCPALSRARPSFTGFARSPGCFGYRVDRRCTGRRGLPGLQYQALGPNLSAIKRSLSVTVKRLSPYLDSMKTLCL